MSKNKTFTGVRTLKKHKEKYSSENNTTEDMLNIINSENSHYKSKKQQHQAPYSMQTQNQMPYNMQHQSNSMQPSSMGMNDVDPSMVNMFLPLNAQQQANANPYLSDVNMRMPQMSDHVSMSEQMPMLGMPQQAPQHQMMGMPQQAPQMMGMPQQQMMNMPQQQMMGMPQQASQMMGMPQQQMMLSDQYSMSEGMPQSNLANLASLASL